MIQSGPQQIHRGPSSMRSKRTHRVRIAIGTVSADGMCRAYQSRCLSVEYIIPLTLVPESSKVLRCAQAGAGLVIGPGVWLIGPNLTKAYLPGAEIFLIDVRVGQFL